MHVSKHWDAVSKKYLVVVLKSADVPPDGVKFPSI